MVKHNAENERIKHQYRGFLQDAKGLSDKSIDQALAAIHAFEMSTKHKPFRLFHIEQARAFTRSIQAENNPKTGKPYAKATLNGTLSALRKFIEWLGGQSEFRKRINYGDAANFGLNEKDQRIARAKRSKRVPTLEEVQSVIRAMSIATDIEIWNRATVSFTFMTGARVEAVVPARLKHIDIEEGLFHQDAKDVRTKRSKTFTTWVFPVGDDIRAIFNDWAAYLNDHLSFGPDDPLFPKTRLVHDVNRRFVPGGLTREPWASGAAIRKIFATAFTDMGLPPAHPHIMRDTLATLGERRCTTPEEFKVWSQNIGHDQVITTLKNCGPIEPNRQAALIRHLAGPKSEHVGEVMPEMIEAVLNHLRPAT